MSDKPSLYVVEKKEVVILVVLFVLVTVLSFTIGVRYGESVGKKAAIEKKAAEEEVGGHEAESIGGKLGSADEKSEAHGDSAHGDSAHGDSAHGAESSEHSDHAATEGKEATKPARAEEKPEVAAGKDSADKDSDEYLLNALKDSGVEPPGGKSPDNSSLPQEVKKAPKPGTYVIQVGSHPTRSEAESQIKKLQAKNVRADVLPPFKDRQGEWHRVVISGFKTKRDAEREASQLKSKGAFSSFFVWRLP